MTLHVMYENGSPTRVIEDVAYFSIYPQKQGMAKPFLRVEVTSPVEQTVEYISLEYVSNVWSRDES